MLVLSRSPGESIIITCQDGTQIKVKVVNANREGRARLAFDAPTTVRIDREEVHLLRQQEREQG